MMNIKKIKKIIREELVRSSLVGPVVKSPNKGNDAPAGSLLKQVGDEGSLTNGQVGAVVAGFANENNGVAWFNLSNYISEYDANVVMMLKEDGYKNFYIVEIPKSDARSIDACHYIAFKSAKKEFPWSWTTDKLEV